MLCWRAGTYTESGAIARGTQRLTLDQSDRPCLTSASRSEHVWVRRHREEASAIACAVMVIVSHQLDSPAFASTGCFQHMRWKVRHLQSLNITGFRFRVGDVDQIPFELESIKQLGGDASCTVTSSKNKDISMS